MKKLLVCCIALTCLYVVPGALAHDSQTDSPVPNICENLPGDLSSSQQTALQALCTQAQGDISAFHTSVNTIKATHDAAVAAAQATLQSDLAAARSAYPDGSPQRRAAFSDAYATYRASVADANDAASASIQQAQEELQQALQSLAAQVQDILSTPPDNGSNGSGTDPGGSVPDDNTPDDSSSSDSSSDLLPADICDVEQDDSDLQDALDEACSSYDDDVATAKQVRNRSLRRAKKSLHRAKNTLADTLDEIDSNDSLSDTEVSDQTDAAYATYKAAKKTYTVRVRKARRHYTADKSDALDAFYAALDDAGIDYSGDSVDSSYDE